jgi:hypothetical protein
MNEKRKQIRYQSSAKVWMEDREGDLKDFSLNGCCIRIAFSADMENGREYRIEIVPEAEAQVAAFTIGAEICWIRREGDFCEAGFFITRFPEGELFRRYADYLAWRVTLP